jgi:hypothetical protein
MEPPNLPNPSTRFSKLHRFILAEGRLREQRSEQDNKLITYAARIFKPDATEANVSHIHQKWVLLHYFKLPQWIHLGLETGEPDRKADPVRYDNALQSFKRAIKALEERGLVISITKGEWNITAEGIKVAKELKLGELKLPPPPP